MNTQKPVNVAHRGLTKRYPHRMGNTLTAFLHARDSGVDAVELDIQMTRDGELVVFHDPLLNVKTNGRGAVRHHTLAELRQLHIRGTQERIPTVEEVFQLFAGHQTRLILDFSHSQILERLTPLIAQYDLQNQVEYTSINHRLLKKVKDQDPLAKTAPTFFTPRTNYIIRQATRLQTGTIHLFYPLLFLNPRMLPRLHKAGIHVRAFTVDSPLLAYLLMQRGASIISNRSAQSLKRPLKSRRPRPKER